MLSKIELVEDQKLLKILLVNDDEDDAFILFEVSQSFPANIYLGDIRPGIDIIGQINSFAPDIILLDIHLSSINGIDLLRQIKSKRALRHLPVIIYASRQHSVVVRKCFDLGATLFVEKPHTYKGVERMLKRILQIDWNRNYNSIKEVNFILLNEDY